jgi:hypothetical protein
VRIGGKKENNINKSGDGCKIHRRFLYRKTTKKAAAIVNKM